VPALKWRLLCKRDSPKQLINRWLSGRVELEFQARCLTVHIDELNKPVRNWTHRVSASSRLTSLCWERRCGSLLERLHAHAGGCGYEVRHSHQAIMSNISSGSRDLASPRKRETWCRHSYPEEFLITYWPGAKIRSSAACAPWRRNARNRRSSSGEKKAVRAPLTVVILVDSL
jgi:hypothetical protein